MIKILILIISLSQVFAEECSSTNKNVDLRSEFPPMRDQDSIGWCYSFASADVMGQWMGRHRDSLPERIKHLDFKKEENSVSASYMALNYNRYTDNDKIEKEGVASYFKNVEDLNKKIEVEQKKILNLCRQIGEYAAQKICSTQITPGFDDELEKIRSLAQNQQAPKSSLLSQALIHFNEIDQSLYDLRIKKWNAQLKALPSEGGYNDRALELSFKNGFLLEKDMRSEDFNSGDLNAQFYELQETFVNKKGQEAICTGERILSGFGPALKLSSEMEEVLSNYTKGNGNPAFAIASHSPLLLKLSPAPNISSPFWKDKNSFNSFINEKLNQGKAIAISYHPWPIFLSSKELNKDPSRAHGAHASTIVGKLCAHGHEKYILRNTWGEKSCQTFYQKLLNEKDSRTLSRIGIVSNNELKSCLARCDQMTVDNFARDFLKNYCRNNCYAEKAESIDEKLNMPFQCDKEGNYIVDKDLMLNNIFDTTALD